MTETIYHLRGRYISPADLATVQFAVAQHLSKGRSAISRLICEQWNWRQPNGELKERACRAMLVSLEQKGLIDLLPRLRGNFRRSSRSTRQLRFDIDTSDIDGKLSDFPSPILAMIRNTGDEALWDYFIDRYHYLSKPAIVGANLKFIARIDGRPVACLGWGSASWQVACRDSHIGWDATTREANLHKIVNNVRFLILPWVRIPHLASKVLAANIRVLASEWMKIYSHPVNLLETFVDQSMFQGTCYKAANWNMIGETIGRGKYGATRGVCSTKTVWIYPLVDHYREMLLG
ncbi:MAG: Druantia anti-phage system protein DruA [Deltaproteobacteria bacterium]